MPGLTVATVGIHLVAVLAYWQVIVRAMAVSPYRRRLGPRASRRLGNYALLAASGLLLLTTTYLHDYMAYSTAIANASLLKASWQTALSATVVFGALGELSPVVARPPRSAAPTAASSVVPGAGSPRPASSDRRSRNEPDRRQ